MSGHDDIMPMVIDEGSSPFKRTAAGALAGQGDDTADRPKNGRRGRPLACSEDWAPVFLAALMEGLTIKHAAQRAGVDITMPYHRRKTDEAFHQAWNEAVEVGTELLEAEAVRRAYHGTVRPVYHKGVRVGSIRDYDSQLMQLMLKARKPAVYREGREENAAPMVLNINIVTVDADRSGVDIPANTELADATNNHHLLEQADSEPPGATAAGADT
jgi:hypothetical protein